MLHSMNESTGSIRHPHSPLHVPELYVADLSFFCSEDHLRELFCQYGHVVNIRIIRGGVRKRSLSFGFVTMSNLQQAQQAIQALHGHLFMGRHMKVELADTSRNSKILKSSSSHSQDSLEASPVPGFQVHIIFTSSFNSPTDFILPTEAFIRRAFCRFGTILDVCVKEYSIDSSPVSHQQGYGFITFAEETGAFSALEHGKSLVFEGIHFACTESRRYSLTNPLTTNASIGNGESFRQASNVTASSLDLTRFISSRSTTNLDPQMLQQARGHMQIPLQNKGLYQGIDERYSHFTGSSQHRNDLIRIVGSPALPPYVAPRERAIDHVVMPTVSSQQQPVMFSHNLSISTEDMTRRHVDPNSSMPPFTRSLDRTSQSPLIHHNRSIITRDTMPQTSSQYPYPPHLHPHYFQQPSLHPNNPHPQTFSSRLPANDLPYHHMVAHQQYDTMSRKQRTRAHLSAMQQVQLDEDVETADNFVYQSDDSFKF